MATAAGISIVAGMITLGNDALNAPYTKGTSSVASSINWRVIPATAVAAALFAGLESLNATLAKGLASVALVTTLIHPFGNGQAPLVHLASVLGYSSSNAGSPYNAPLPTPTGPISV